MLISAVIPSYNYGRFVAQAVESVLAQTHRTAEVIVVDDGSTDDTSARLQPFGDRIRCIRQVNQGVAAARNNGILAAQSEYVALLDADDLWEPGKLETQCAAFREHPEAVLIGTNCYDIGEQPKLGTGIVEHTLADFIERPLLSPSSVMGRRQSFVDMGLFDEDRAVQGSEDMDMLIRMAARGPVFRLRAPLTAYRVHGAGANTRTAKMFNSHGRVLDKSFRTIPALREQSMLRRKGEARRHREAAWSYFASGDRSKAVWHIIESVTCWPLALSDIDGKRRLWRAKMLARFIAGAGYEYPTADI